MSEVAPPAYLQQDAQMTLREALDEYYRSNPSLLDPQGMPDAPATLFRQHDVAHVIFGCDTSLRGEVCTDSWTVFATTIGLRGALEYFRYPQVNQVFAEAGIWNIVLASLRTVPAVVSIFLRSRKMKQPWPWVEFDVLFERRLCDLRKQYGVRVLG